MLCRITVFLYIDSQTEKKFKDSDLRTELQCDNIKMMPTDVSMYNFLVMMLSACCVQVNTAHLFSKPDSKYKIYNIFTLIRLHIFSIFFLVVYVHYPNVSNTAQTIILSEVTLHFVLLPVTNTTQRMRN